MNRIMVLLSIALLGWAAAAGAEEAVLFSAAEAGADAWTWDGAKLEGQGGKLLLSRDKGEVSAVVLDDRFAYVPDGVVDINVEQVMAGTYTVQVLAFKGSSYLGAADVLKDTAQFGVKVFQLSKLELPAGTETISFKLWVSKQGGSSVLINDLRYYVSVEPGKVVFDKKVDTATAVTADKAKWVAAVGGGNLMLAAGEKEGSVVFPDQIAKPDKGTLILQVAGVKNGTLTAQLCAFDAAGNYLSSVDAIKRATASMSCALDSLPWPADTATFQIKLWIGGTPEVFATVKRLLVLR